MADGRPLEDQMAEALAQQAQTQQATTQQPMMLRDALGREVPLSAERQALLRKRTQPQPKAQGATERPPALHADDPAAGDARLAALLKAPAYLDKNHVDHAKAVTDVREYLQQKYQEPDAADLADAPDIGELRRFVGAELPWMPAHAEAKCRRGRRLSQFRRAGKFEDDHGEPTDVLVRRPCSGVWRLRSRCRGCVP